MPIFETIKVSQEINFNGMPTWVSLGGYLIPGEDEIEAIRATQKKITDYQTQEQQAYSKSKWKVLSDAEYGGNGKEKPDPVTGMITAITTCTTIATLKTFEKLAKSKPEFQEAYDNRLKQLTNGI